MPMTLTRSIMAILIPGLVAVSPWLLWTAVHTDVANGYEKYQVVANAVLFAIVAVAGTVCEGLATLLESKWDKEREVLFSVRENWLAYLATMLSPEPVGYRYISRLATTLYFELSMIFATPVFVAGVTALLIGSYPGQTTSWLPHSIVAAVISAAYFWWQARCTHRVLCDTRQELIGRLEGRQGEGGRRARADQGGQVDK